MMSLLKALASVVMGAILDALRRRRESREREKMVAEHAVLKDRADAWSRHKETLNEMREAGDSVRTRDDAIERLRKGGF